MCGICGVYTTNPSVLEQRLFRQLLFINALRGTDSTGVVRVERDKSVKSYKAALSSPEFLYAQEHNKFITSKLAMAYIGHTRSATKGTVTVENAHPFEFPNVVGVHNGTVHKMFKYDNLYDTDSEAIYRNINDHGLKPTLEELRAQYSSSVAYALAYVDKKERSLNFVRNSQRELTFTYLFNRSTLIWSSDLNHLETIVKENGLEPMAHSPESENTYWTLNPNDLMTLKIGEHASTAKIYGTGVDPLLPFVNTSSPGFDDYEQWWLDKGDKNKLKNKTKSSRVPQTGTRWEQDKDGFYKVVRGNDAVPFSRSTNGKGRQFPSPRRALYDDSPPINEAELAYKLTKGCCLCGVVIDIDEDANLLPEISWYNRDLYLCPDCTSTHYILDIMNGDFRGNVS